MLWNDFKNSEVIMKNIGKKKSNREKLSIGTTFALSMSLLVAVATIGMAVYAVFFVDSIFSFFVPQDSMYSTILTFRENLQRIVIAFLIFGLILSYYMTKIIISPLEKLINGTKELSEGNLKYRVEFTKYTEINQLVQTYNQMAENLQSLYDNLEKKVQERTKELKLAYEELENTQIIMVHSEKMRSLGELVAGITHEINNPINFIHGNMTHLKNYSKALIELIEVYQNYENDLSEEKRDTLNKIKQEVEYSFIKEDLPMLIQSCQEGTERTKNIILDLKNFSRIEELVVNEIDLKREIETILNILHNKIKYKAEVIKEYDQDFPIIEGYGGQLNQVFMNILDNACYAIEKKGKIYIRLKKEQDNVIIEIEDTGSGMSEDQLKKIFDPFYTTKPQGEGTGLGMSISYKVIQNHGGQISAHSQLGKGSLFRIKLPVVLDKKRELSYGKN